MKEYFDETHSLGHWIFCGHYFLSVFRGPWNHIRLHLTHCQRKHGVETQKNHAFFQLTTSVDGLVNELENITEVLAGKGEEPYEAEELD